jgi:hypothetical protein
MQFRTAKSAKHAKFLAWKQQSSNSPIGESEANCNAIGLIRKPFIDGNFSFAAFAPFAVNCIVPA